jgi:hypothetical protein
MPSIASNTVNTCTILIETSTTGVNTITYNWTSNTSTPPVLTPTGGEQFTTEPNTYFNTIYTLDETAIKNGWRLTGAGRCYATTPMTVVVTGGNVVPPQTHDGVKSATDQLSVNDIVLPLDSMLAYATPVTTFTIVNKGTSILGTTISFSLGYFNIQSLATLTIDPQITNIPGAG